METTEARRRKSSNKKKLKEVDDLQDYAEDKLLTNEERQVGDGAPAESELEPVQAVEPTQPATDRETPAASARILLRLRLDVDVLSLGLLLLALFTRLPGLDQPRHIVFDELHYGRYVSLYARGVFFFDAHPPLGKQLIYMAGRAAGYDGNFTFDKIGTPYPPEVPVFALRLVPALCGSLMVPLTYHLMLEVAQSQWTAVLAALLVLLENAFLVQSRFMLLECIQLVFALGGLLGVLRATRRRGLFAALWLAPASLALGCCFSIKYSGLYTYWLGVFLVVRQLWRRLGRGEAWRTLLPGLCWRAGLLLVLPAAVYVGSFYAHLRLLPRAGPHDSAMTSAFQASLDGGLASITRGQPLHVAHGSQITLRHAHGRACWLHSHAHVYPLRYADERGSSHQQQVTCYSFKDVNNWWLVKRPEVASLAVARPPDAVRHGDVVQLLHGITSRALNSHDVAAPVSPQSQEVSCYIDYNVSMSAQNLWRVEIVNREREDATWDSIRSLVRLVHVGSGSALRYSGRQLPAWGFHQHEVVADRALDHRDVQWNVEEHRYTNTEDKRERERQLVSAEMIPTATTQLTFWEKFLELQYKMLVHAADAPHDHMFSSEPLEWPLLARTVAYWLSPTSNAQVHLIGNPVVWWTGSAGLLAYSALLAAYLVRRRRGRRDLSPAAWMRFQDAGALLLGGYLLHYLPYWFAERTLFLHHYLSAHLFKLMLLACVVEHALAALRPRALRAAAALALGAWLALSVAAFLRFSALNYGTAALAERDLLRLRWRDSWDFILHKRQ